MLIPNQCYIELNQKCNLTCAHCFANGSPDASPELTYEDVVSIYKQLEKLPPVYVNLSGGEPLLNNDFFKIVEFAANYPYATCILTNGIGWDKNTIDELADRVPNKNVRIQISMDGPYEVMAKQRNISKEQYDKIIDNAKYFNECGFSVSALTVIDKVTAPHAITTAHKMLEDNIFRAVQLVPLFLTGRALENLEMLEDFWESWSEIVVRVTKIIKHNRWGNLSNRINIGFFTLYELFVPLEDNDMIDDVLNVWGLDIENLSNFRHQIRRPFYCECGQSELTISSEMKLFPCVASIRTGLTCGSLRKSAIEDIWKNSTVLNYFREDAVSVRLNEPCVSCRLKDFCGGGCRLVPLSMNGDINGLDIRCPYVIRFINSQNN
ncbi:MAG: radical SAM protein [Defluviitaleaceae bacterium]|nr:radical SAM protein [Defluviitaleaceae bacterium]